MVQVLGCQRTIKHKSRSPARIAAAAAAKVIQHEDRQTCTATQVLEQGSRIGRLICVQTDHIGAGQNDGGEGWRVHHAQREKQHSQALLHLVTPFATCRVSSSKTSRTISSIPAKSMPYHKFHYRVF